jgi:hypothetical protein
MASESIARFFVDENSLALVAVTAAGLRPLRLVEA